MKSPILIRIIRKIKDGLNPKFNSCIEHIVAILRLVLNFKEEETTNYFYFESKIIFILPSLMWDQTMIEFAQDILTNKYQWLTPENYQIFFDFIINAGFFDTFNEMLIGNKQMLDWQTQYGFLENLGFTILDPKFAEKMDDEIELRKKQKNNDKYGWSDSLNMDNSHVDEFINGTAENYNFEEELSEEEETGLSVEYVESTFDVIEELIALEFEKFVEKDDSINS